MRDYINANFEALKDAIQAIDTGAVLLSGEGTPSDSIGNLGSFYIDVTTFYLLGPKADQGWGNGVSFVMETI